MLDIALGMGWQGSLLDPVGGHGYVARKLRLKAPDQWRITNPFRT